MRRIYSAVVVSLSPILATSGCVEPGNTAESTSGRVDTVFVAQAPSQFTDTSLATPIPESQETPAAIEVTPPPAPAIVQNSPPSAPTPVQAAPEPPASNGTQATAGELGSEQLAGRISAGTTLVLTSLDKVCTDKNAQGDRFRAELQETVNGTNGAVLHKGAVATFVVSELQRSGKKGEPITFVIAPESIVLDGVAHGLEARVDSITIKDKKQGIFGALAGAALGAAAAKVAGGDTKAVLAGAAAGGVAGAVISNRTRNVDGCIEKNAFVRITLTAEFLMSGS